MKIFLASTSLEPSQGGPAYSVARLAGALADAGQEVGLWTADSSGVTRGARHGARTLSGTLHEALDAFGPADVAHDNGLWLSHHHQLAVAAHGRGIPRVVSTRGMLEPWALGHKRVKKRIAWELYQRRDLKRAQCLHATSATEAGNLRSLALGVPIRMIPNGVDVPATAGIGPPPAAAPPPVRTALFLGRLYPIKGLPVLIESWRRVRPVGWHLKIAGPDEAGHRRVLEKQVHESGLVDAVSFAGPLEGAAKEAALLGADLFVLATHSESFGMAIAEAMAHGVPVLTTRAAPWPDLSRRGCGWWVDDAVDGFADALRQATALDSATLRAMGSRGRRWMEAEFGWASVARQFLALYQELAGAA